MKIKKEIILKVGNGYRKVVGNIFEVNGNAVSYHQNYIIYHHSIHQHTVVFFQAAMMSLAYKEGIKIPPPALNEVISAANQDIRQVIHNLSMWTASDKALTYDQVKKDAAKAHKDMKMVRRGVGEKRTI